jgi:hypothetical protein
MIACFIRPLGSTPIGLMEACKSSSPRGTTTIRCECGLRSQTPRRRGSGPSRVALRRHLRVQHGLEPAAITPVGSCRPTSRSPPPPIRRGAPRWQRSSESAADGEQPGAQRDDDPFERASGAGHVTGRRSAIPVGLDERMPMGTRKVEFQVSAGLPCPPSSPENPALFRSELHSGVVSEPAGRRQIRHRLY